MNGFSLLAILLAIIIIVIIIMAIFFSLSTGGDLLDLKTTVEGEVDKAQAIRDRFVSTFSPYVDLTKEDATDFLKTFYVQNCVSSTFFCNMYDHPDLYQKQFCIPACEVMIATRGTCLSDPVLQNNAICQLIPTDLTIENIAQDTGYTIQEILEEYGFPREKLPPRMRDRLL